MKQNVAQAIFPEEERVTLEKCKLAPENCYKIHKKTGIEKFQELQELKMLRAVSVRFNNSKLMLFSW